jgi:hypothetical protein
MSIREHALLGYALWALVAAGWIVLAAHGLQPDRPLRREIPGRRLHAARTGRSWAGGDRMGEAAGWLLFGAACVLLLGVLYWALAAHTHALWLPHLAPL